MSILKSLADVMDLKYSTQEVQNLPKQSCNNALMAKKSPKDNKCPKSQEIRRRKNSQVNITQGARKYTKYTKVYHMTKVEWGKIHRSKTKLNHQKEVRERGDRTN